MVGIISGIGSRVEAANNNIRAPQSKMVREEVSLSGERKTVPHLGEKQQGGPGRAPFVWIRGAYRATSYCGSFTWTFTPREAIVSFARSPSVSQFSFSLKWPFPTATFPFLPE